MSHLFSPATSAIRKSAVRRITRLARNVVAVSLALLAAATASAQSTPQFVYTASTSNHLIFGFQLNTTTGALTSVPGSPFDERLSPNALAVNPAGTFLFVANGADNDISVFQINTTSGALTEIPNSPFSAGIALDPVRLITDPTGKYLFVANDNIPLQSGELDVYLIDPVTGQLTPGPSSTPPSAGLFAPADPVAICVHPNGLWLYIQGNNGQSNGQEDSIEQYVFDPSTGNAGSSQFLVIGEGSTALAGDPAGKFLFTGWGGPGTGRLSPLTISPVDGTLTQGNFFDICSYLNEMIGCLNHFYHATVDSTGTYLYANVGSFFTNPLTADQVLLGSPIPQGSWVADKLGNFVFASDGLGNVIHVYSIDLSTGILTEVLGSPFSETNGSVDAIVVTGFPPQTIAPLEGFSPAGLTFTNTTVGVPSSPQTIEIVNPGTAPLTISNVSITGTNAADFSQTNTCAAPLNPGHNCAATVIYTPSTTAAESASLTVTDNAAGSPQSAPLTATGIISTPPSAVFNPTSLTFSQTTIGATLSQNIQLTNTGTQTLTISPASITGANPGDFTQSNNCGASLIGGASCTITVVFQPQAVGQRTATLNFPNNGGPQTVALSGQGVQATSTTALASNLNPSFLHQSVTFTATVTPQFGGAASGTVTFKNGSTSIGSSTLAGNVAAFTTSTLPIAANSITAVYGGDANVAGSSSAVLTQTVHKDPTTVVVTSSANPISIGQTVTFTATVNSSFGAIPNGEIVTFKNGTATLGTGSLSGGMATFTTSSLPIGSNSIRATYPGDVTFLGSTSPTFTETVNKFATTSTVTSNANPSSFGQTVTFTATVTATSGGTPAGTVTFKNGSATLGTRNLTGGTASLATSELTVGTHSITVVYNGDATHAASTSPAISQVVNKAATTTSLTSSPNPSTVGQSVTFTATVTSTTSGTPTGSVTFKSGTKLLGSAQLAGGVATLSTTALAKGSDTITATYNGSANFTGSSASLTQVVN